MGGSGEMSSKLKVESLKFFAIDSFNNYQSLFIFFFGAVSYLPLLKIGCGYPLQSFCSFLTKRISASIRQPFSR
jgi:hypothetical protein